MEFLEAGRYASFLKSRCVTGWVYWEITMRKDSNMVIRTLILGASIILCSPAMATKSYFNGVGITEVRIHGSGAFGGCVMAVNTSVRDGGNRTLDPYCDNSVVSFSCNDSSIQSKTESNNMLNMALFAVATDRTINMQVNDEKRKNGTCVADVISIN